MQNVNTRFQYVDYLWQTDVEESLGGNEVDLLIYRSNLLGADLRLTNYGGGNTSCKTIEKDPLTDEPTEVMWVKGSGGDLGTLRKNGLAALYMDRLNSLKNIYRGLEFEDEMVDLYNHCIFDLSSKAPSIDTALHAFLPFKHIDHLHPDSAIAIAAAKDSEEITRDLFEGEMAWVPWQRPGFDLGLQLERAVLENPGVSGIMLGGHGLFTWGDTSYESYMNSLEVIEKASIFLQQNYGKSRPVFGGMKIKALEKEERENQAAGLAPVLRGLCSSHSQMIGHFSDDERILEFTGAYDLDKLAPMGTSCPDHFLRTKIRPLVLDLKPDEDIDDPKKLSHTLELQYDNYRKSYAQYYDQHKRSNSPPIRDPNPVVILWPGVGMFTFAKNKQTARVASEFYINAVNVMKGAEAISEYTALPPQEAFDIEYWLLEEAKLQRMPKEKSLSRKIALVTGSGGGIGKAIAKKMLESGACVVISDFDRERLTQTSMQFREEFGPDSFVSHYLDVTNSSEIDQAYKLACLSFGGIDIIVNNAGISISNPVTDYTESEWDNLFDTLVKGQFLVSKAGIEIMRKQHLGGDIVNIVSKNALVAGPDNTGYSSAKAAQLHMSRLLAAELGKDRIRVNSVNPDAVIFDSKIWAGDWAADRSKAHGVPIEELPAFYAKRTLLNEIIYPDDIAEGVLVLVNGSLRKSTGNAINIDGGIPAAFLR